MWHLSILYSPSHFLPFSLLHANEGDGLDKVCSDIVLPKLSRDDWLVFVDLGFCNVGTCFNGFAPPDIACCALGGTRAQ